MVVPCTAVVLAITVLAAACGTGSDRARAADPTPGGTIAWTECQDELRCGTLTVPVDHDAPQRQKVTLALAVRPADPDADRVGVLLTNPGGPGASGIETLRSGLPLATEVLDRFDVVSWDPRGSGQSTPIDCGSAYDEVLGLDPHPDSDDRGRLDRLAPRVVEECRERSGAVVDHMAATDHVGDMEAIRRATGEATINYLGFSYGTRIGLDYLRRHPQHVRTMVLDSVVPPDLTLAELLITQARELEDRTAELLDGQESILTAVRGEAESAELPGLNGALDPVRVDRALVLAGYDPALAEQFSAALDRAKDGDGEPLDALGLRYERLVDLPAYLATSCGDGRAPADEAGWDDLEARILDVAPVVGPVVANELRPCAYWPEAAPRSESQDGPGGPAAGTGFESSPERSPTVLLVSNTEDPATPVDWARSVATVVPGATLTEVGEVGHIALDGSGCARDRTARVLTTGTAPADSDCL